MTGTTLYPHAHRGVAAGDRRHAVLAQPAPSGPPTAPVLPLEYAAKLVCGRTGDENGMSFVPGAYATAINVHNPSRENGMVVKVALAAARAGRGRCTPFSREFPLALRRGARVRLPPGRAAAGKCPHPGTGASSPASSSSNRAARSTSSPSIRPARRAARSPASTRSACPCGHVSADEGRRFERFCFHNTMMRIGGLLATLGRPKSFPATFPRGSEMTTFSSSPAAPMAMPPFPASLAGR